MVCYINVIGILFFEILKLKLVISVFLSFLSQEIDFDFILIKNFFLLVFVSLKMNLGQ